MIAFTESQYGKFYYWPHDQSVGQTVARGEFWDAHFRPVMDGLRLGQVMVDVGANIGFFSIYLGLRGVLVHAFEPSTDCFELLCRNIEVNGLQGRVIAHNVPLYDRETSLTLAPAYMKDVAANRIAEPAILDDGRPNFETLSNTATLSLVPGNGQYTQTAYPLDSFGLVDVALIKSDAQGCDLRVLQGARQTISRYHPILCYEFETIPSEWHGLARSDYEQFIAEIGYVSRSVHYEERGYTDYVATFEGKGSDGVALG